MTTVTLAKLELDDEDLVSRVEDHLNSGASVSLFSRSSGSGEACHMTFKPKDLETATAADMVQSFQDRAKSFWDQATKSVQVRQEYVRQPRGKINHYVKVRGKEA